MEELSGKGRKLKMLPSAYLLIVIGNKTLTTRYNLSLDYGSLFPQRLPLGMGYENSNNQKNRKRVVDDGKREKAGSLSSLFPLPIVPRALSFYFSPASPQHKEVSAQERVIMDRIGLSLLWRRKRFLAGRKGQFVSRSIGCV